MRLTKRTSYAVRILLRCPKNDEGYVRASDIARLEGITRYNVLKIMPLLARAGFITTNRGRTGGVKLARPACEIDLGDVFRATRVDPYRERICGREVTVLKEQTTIAGQYDVGQSDAGVYRCARGELTRRSYGIAHAGKTPRRRSQIKNAVRA